MQYIQFFGAKAVHLNKISRFTKVVNDFFVNICYNIIVAVRTPQVKYHTERKINMNLTKKINDTELTVAIEGRVDTVTSPELDKLIKESVDGMDSLVIDMKDVEYISSAGLRVLLSSHKLMSKKGGMTVINAGEDIMEIFEVTGFSDILNIK